MGHAVPMGSFSSFLYACIFTPSPVCYGAAPFASAAPGASAATALGASAATAQASGASKVSSK